MTTADLATASITDLTGILVGLSAVFGLLVGSFLNVVVHRVPAGLSVVHPGSSCPGCGHEIAWYDNVPVLSWLILRGRCRGCTEPISIRYPLVEAATGALFAATTWWLLPEHPGLVPWFLWLAAGAVALTLIDIEHLRLPTPILVVMAIGSVPGMVLAGVVSGQWPLLRVALSALLWLFAIGAPWYLTAGRGMGFGDVKLAPILGAALGWLGWDVSIPGLGLAFLTGAVIGVLILLVRARRTPKRQPIPFGPFLLGGAALSVVAGVPLSQTYLRLTGLA